jgi:uncharacterized protein YuzE
MRITYDKKHNIAYIRFREKIEEVQTLQISDELNIDIAPDGTLYGIELLNANEQIYSQDKGNLILEDAVRGTHSEYRLCKYRR